MLIENTPETAAMVGEQGLKAHNVSHVTLSALAPQGDNGFLGFYPHDFEPDGAHAPPGQWRPSKIDSRLSHLETQPGFFYPEREPLSRPADWFEALGWSDESHPRHNHTRNERFVRVREGLEVT